MMPYFLSWLSVLSINVNWSSITDPIGRMFNGGSWVDPVTGHAQSITGIMGDPTMTGMFIFLILFVLTMVFGLGMLIGSVIIIPSLFAVFEYIPELRILVAIICGLIFGMGLHRLVKR
jgi:hypothetical protein